MQEKARPRTTKPKHLGFKPSQQSLHIHSLYTQCTLLHTAMRTVIIAKPTRCVDCKPVQDHGACEGADDGAPVGPHAQILHQCANQVPRLHPFPAPPPVPVSVSLSAESKSTGVFNMVVLAYMTRKARTESVTESRTKGCGGSLLPTLTFASQTQMGWCSTAETQSKKCHENFGTVLIQSRSVQGP